MLSKAKTKFIQSLQQKKIRVREQLFVVEGDKMVSELLLQKHFKLHSIYATETWINKNITITSQYKGLLTTISSNELKKISSLKTPNQILALVHIPKSKINSNKIKNSISIVLENIQDPGNMGSIIRIADWFGISTIVCSKGCVDCYNSKVIQATMGSFLRTNIVYTDLESLFKEYAELPVYGAVLGGENVYKTDLASPAFLLIGNEGNGLSESIKASISHAITIPKSGGAESLNAAVATGILCALFFSK